MVRVPSAVNFYDGLEGFGAAPAIITEQGDRLSYAELAALADGVGSSMEPRRVALLACSNNLESLIGYLACLRARVVPLLVGAGSGVEQLNGLIEAYRPDYVWAPRDHALADGRDTVKSHATYALLRNKSKPGAPLNDALGLLLTTSGSTGS